VLAIIAKEEIKVMSIIKSVIFFILILILVSCTHDDGYRVEGNRVVFEQPWNEGYGTKISELDADVATFEVLGNDNLSWAKDKDKIWWGYMEFNNMDPSTFEALTISVGKDKDKVICGNRIMKEANPAEFKIRTYIDKKGKKNTYGVDKHGAFLCSDYPNGYSYLSSNSIEFFQKLEDGFYKDKEKVWWGHLALPDVKSSKFKVLSGGYATDENHIYYHWRIVQGADLATFKVTGSMYAQDKNYRYEMERRVKR